MGSYLGSNIPFSGFDTVLRTNHWWFSSLGTLVSSTALRSLCVCSFVFMHGCMRFTGWRGLGLPVLFLLFLKVPLGFIVFGVC